MTGIVVQVNVSRGGLPKRPIAQARLTPQGVEGDSYGHPQIHGGVRQAVLLVAAETVDQLTVLGYPLFYGALGENLTVRGLDPKQWRSGQRFRAGEALIELTRIRVPCSSLDIYGPSLKRRIYDPEVHAGNPEAACWAMSGFYAAVIESGVVRANDIITLESLLA